MAKDYDPTALLNTPLDDVKAPVNMPNGTYLWLVTERKFDKSTQKKTDYVEFTLVPLEAGPDVDEAELAAAIEQRPLNERSKTETFYLTPDALFRLKEWALDSVSVPESEASNIAELIEACLNRQVMGTLGSKNNPNNPERPYQNFVGWAAAPTGE